MPPANTGNFPQHLAPGLRQIIGTALEGRETFYSRITNVGTTVRKYEDYLAATGLPVAVEKPEGTDIQSFDVLESATAGIGGGGTGTKRLTPKCYAIGAEVTMEAWEDDLYKNQGSAIRLIGEGLADSLAEKQEILAHDPLVNSTSTTHNVLPDNSNWIATSHLSIIGAQGPAQANKPSTATDLNLTAFRNGLIAMRKWKDDQGKRIPGFARPKLLVVSPDFEYDALEILRSPMRPDTANNVVNVTQGAVQVVATPYLADETNSDAWFIFAQKHFMECLWRKRPAFDSFEERRAKINVFVGLMRVVTTPVHWLGIYGDVGAA